MQTIFDPSEVFAEAATGAATVVLQEAVKNQLSQAGFSAIFVAASEEFAKSIVLTVLGPVLRTFLKLVDPTQTKLDSILREPLQTGVALAHQALSMQIGNENDTKLRDQNYYSSLQSLEKAYSYGRSQKKSEECLKIRLAQASVAKAMNAPGAVKTYLEEYALTLRQDLSATESMIASYQTTAAKIEKRMSVKEQEAAAQLGSYFARVGLGAVKSALDLLPSPSRPNYAQLLREMSGRDGIISTQATRTGVSSFGDLRSSVDVRLRLQIAQNRADKLRAFTRFWGI